jgi:hypothetical protein
VNLKVFISAPYTNPDPVINTRKAITVANDLMELGFIPWIPHLNLFWHLVYPQDPDYWYAYDLEWLKVCDCVLRLPGESVGADREVEVAKKIGIPVFYSIDELLRG